MIISKRGGKKKKRRLWSHGIKTSTWTRGFETVELNRRKHT
jgi:hypothetical protein